jgi:type IV secretory pathway TrbL component
MEKTRNFYAVILAGLVLVVTIVALLGIWDLIEWEDFKKYFNKSLLSLLVIFISSALILFIFSVLFKSQVKPPKPPENLD